MKNLELKNAFVKLESISNNNKSLRRKILASTSQQNNNLMLFAKGFSIAIILALILLYATHSYQVVSTIPETTNEAFLVDSLFQMESIANFRNTAMIILAGTLQLFVKFSILAFILTAAAMPGPRSNSNPGEMKCPD